MEALPYILIINGALIALFFLYLLTTRLWQKLLWKVNPKKVIVPMFGARVKIRTLGAIYDSRFRGITQGGWAIESLAEAIPAVRMGEPLLVEIACEKGVVRFRSELVELLSEANATIMRPPIETLFGNRRNKKRVVMENRPIVQLEGANAVVFDLSEGGTRVSTNKAFRKGQRVTLVITGWKEPLPGHVLEVLPNATRGFVNDVRIVFENPVKLAALTKKIASA